MYLAYFLGEDMYCTRPAIPAIPAMTIDQLPKFFWLKEHGTKVLHQLQEALQKKDAQTSRPENAWWTMGGFGDRDDLLAKKTWRSLGVSELVFESQSFIRLILILGCDLLKVRKSRDWWLEQSVPGVTNLTSSNNCWRSQECHKPQGSTIQGGYVQHSVRIEMI